MKKNMLKYMAAALALFAFASCNDIVDYDEGYTALEDQANQGAPVITAVYEVGDTLLENPITEGQVGQMIRIVGRNLNNARSITFNNVEADLTQVYTYSTSANVVIPSERSSEENNQIVYTTDQGSTSYNFTVPFPQLSITGLQSEFVNPGDSVTILGLNFDFYDFGTSSQVMLNGTPLGVGSITNTSMKAEIPADTPDNSTLKIVYSNNDGEQTISLPYRPTQNLLYGDFSGVSFNNDGTMAYSIEGDDATSADETSLGRQHLHFTGTFDAWAWNTVDLSCNMINSADLGDLSQAGSLDDYVLKFEVYTPNGTPLTQASPLQLSFNWGDLYTWTPGDGAGLNTHDEWQTITLPLAPIAVAGIMAPDTWQSLRIAFQPTAAYTADFRIGNIRIERR